MQSQERGGSKKERSETTTCVRVRTKRSIRVTFDFLKLFLPEISDRLRYVQLLLCHTSQGEKLPPNHKAKDCFKRGFCGAPVLYLSGALHSVYASDARPTRSSRASQQFTEMQPAMGKPPTEHQKDHFDAKRVRNLFDSFDIDHNGCISLFEIQESLRRRGIHYTKVLHLQLLGHYFCSS